MTSAIQASQAADLSGLILTASLIGQVIGLASLTDIYLSAAHHDPAHALTVTTVAVAATLVITTACARRARTESADTARSLPAPPQPSTNPAEQICGG
jgi:hypothetical protein